MIQPAPIIVDEAWRRAAIEYRRHETGVKFEDPADPLHPFFVWVTGPAHRMGAPRGRAEANNVRHALTVYSLRELMTEDVEDLVERHPRYLETKSEKRSQVKSVCRRILRNLQSWLALEAIVVLPDEAPAPAGMGGA